MEPDALRHEEAPVDHGAILPQSVEEPLVDLPNLIHGQEKLDLEDHENLHKDEAATDSMSTVKDESPDLEDEEDEADNQEPSREENAAVLQVTMTSASDVPPHPSAVEGLLTPGEVRDPASDGQEEDQAGEGAGESADDEADDEEGGPMSRANFPDSLYEPFARKKHKKKGGGAGISAPANLGKQSSYFGLYEQKGISVPSSAQESAVAKEALTVGSSSNNATTTNGGLPPGTTAGVAIATTSKPVKTAVPGASLTKQTLDSSAVTSHRKQDSGNLCVPTQTGTPSRSEEGNSAAEPLKEQLTPSQLAAMARDQQQNRLHATAQPHNQAHLPGLPGNQKFYHSNNQHPPPKQSSSEESGLILPQLDPSLTGASLKQDPKKPRLRVAESNLTRLRMLYNDGDDKIGDESGYGVVGRGCEISTIRGPHPKWLADKEAAKKPEFKSESLPVDSKLISKQHNLIRLKQFHSTPRHALARESTTMGCGPLTPSTPASFHELKNKLSNIQTQIGSIFRTSTNLNSVIDRSTCMKKEVTLIDPGSGDPYPNAIISSPPGSYLVSNAKTLPGSKLTRRPLPQDTIAFPAKKDWTGKEEQRLGIVNLVLESHLSDSSKAVEPKWVYLQGATVTCGDLLPSLERQLAEGMLDNRTALSSRGNNNNVWPLENAGENLNISTFPASLISRTLPGVPKTSHQQMRGNLPKHARGCVKREPVEPAGLVTVHSSRRGNRTGCRDMAVAHW